MINYDNDGHLCLNTLNNIDALSLTEQLEVNAHLAECESCMENYVSILEAELQAAPEGIAFSVASEIKSMRKQSRRIYNFKVCAAACFAIIMMFTAVFGLMKDSDNPPEPGSTIQQDERKEENNKPIFNDLNDKFFNEFNNLNNKFFDFFNDKGAN